MPRQIMAAALDGSGCASDVVDRTLGEIRHIISFDEFEKTEIFVLAVRRVIGVNAVADNLRTAVVKNIGIANTAIGIVLGLSAGFAPGPLLTLVISETLQHDIKSGIKVAISPIFTDLPIIILTLSILSQLSDFHNILGIISLLGGSVILFMGYESMNPKSPESNFSEIEPKSLVKGI